MTTLTPQAQAPIVLGTTATTLFTVASNSTLLNGRVRFTNTSSGTVKVTLYAVPTLGSAGDSNTMLKAETIAANAHLDVDTGNLPAGSLLSALSDTATAITAHLLGGTVRQ